MADNVTTNPGAGGAVIATDDIGGVQFQRVKIAFGADGVATGVAADTPLPVSIIGGASGDASAAKQDTGNASLAAIDAKLGAAEYYPAIQPVSGTVAVSGAVAVTGSFYQATQPISADSLPLPTGAATEATLLTLAGAVKLEDVAAVSGDPGFPMLAMRQSGDAVSTSNDGDYTLLKIDEEGRLKVASKPASYPDVTGDITAIQATIGTPVAGGTVTADASRASNVMAFCSGTFAGVNCAFEGSLEATGETNWFGLQAVRTNANTIETATGALSAQPVYAWEMSVNALARVRVRATARTSGTQSWRFKLGTYATEPIPAAQATATQPISGSVTATVTPPAPTTPYILNSAATTNGALIVTGTSGVASFYATNTGATAAFVKLYNKATAPTVGTDIPAMIIPVPAAVSGVPGVATLPVGFIGFRFALGLGISITGGAAENDTTAIAAGQVKVMLSRTT